MKKIYLKVREEDRHNLRGMPPHKFPDELDIDPVLKDIAKNLESTLYKTTLKVEKESEINSRR